MFAPRFSWHEKKNYLNQRKHGVSFEEARSVFHDEMARIIFDPDHSLEEERYLLLGISAKFRILVISHAYKESSGEIRIISARRATSREKENYNEGLQ